MSSPAPAPAAEELIKLSQVTFAVPAPAPKLKPQPSKGVADSAYMQRRLSRSNSYRTLVVESSSDAHFVLEAFARIRKPEWQQWKAMLYGCLIDWAILLRADEWMQMDEFVRCVVSCGGAEQMRFLLALAQFDRDGNGTIDDDEWVQYQKLADRLIEDSVTLCGNLALVSTLLLGVTHLVTIGRPQPFVLSDASLEAFGERNGSVLLGTAYFATVLCECCSLFVLCCALITRNCLTNILPTREVKIDMLRTTNALGMQAVITQLMLWSFLIANLLCVLVASPTHGWIGVTLFLAMACAYVFFIAPIRYLSVVLLHEEAKRSLASRGGSFKASKPLSQMLSTV